MEGLTRQGKIERLAKAFLSSYKQTKVQTKTKTSVQGGAQRQSQKKRRVRSHGCKKWAKEVDFGTMAVRRKNGWSMCLVLVINTMSEGSQHAC